MKAAVVSYATHVKDDHYGTAVKYEVVVLLFWACNIQYLPPCMFLDSNSPC
jgi:hypothetical protein